MNPKAQLRYLMELSFFNPDHCAENVQESLLLGVVSCKGDVAVLSDGINSIEVATNKKSVSKKKGKAEISSTLEPNSLYVFKDCSMRMTENGNSVDFELSFSGHELVMPTYFVTKDKNFKPLNIDLSIKDHNILKRKQMEVHISAMNPLKKRIITFDEIMNGNFETDDTSVSHAVSSGKSSLAKSGRKKRKVK